MKTQEQWLEVIGKPVREDFERTLTLVKKFDCPDFDGELYMQATGIRPNGELTFQRLLMVFPKNLTGKLPAVAVPFYYPEAALGFDPETGEELTLFAENPTLLDIVRRGYIAATADAYHLNYIDLPLDREDFNRWSVVSGVLNEEQPGWSGMGKLISDTRLMLDALENDPRVDADRIGIAGHSLGGKMAFYAGCIDPRVKVIMTSDFGFAWHQSNWNDTWYWGDKLADLKEQGFDHTSLLASAAPKPFCLLAGRYDNEESRAMIASATGYEDCPSRLLVVNHAVGHRPPKYAAAAGYGFLDYWLKDNK